MKTIPFHRYFLNCFLLIIPVLAWNIIMINRLPEAFQPETFQRGVPPLLTYGENISRICVFLVVFLMPLRIQTSQQKAGLYIYLAGIILYIASWILLIWFPSAEWSNSLAGFAAPAYTPLFWLVGIAFIGDSFYFHWTYKRWIILLPSFIFVGFHVAHTYWVYCNIY